jgi:exopolysaccharide biosynthesis polyprenyl glycosylphosphotransferase
MDSTRHPLVRWLPLALADVIAINSAFFAAYWLRYEALLGGPIGSHVPYRGYAPWGMALALILIAAFHLDGLYTARRYRAWFETTFGVAAATFVGVAFLVVILYGVRPEAESRLVLPYAALLIVGFVSAVHGADIAGHRRRIRRGEGVVRTLVVGAGEVGRAVMRNIMAQPDLGYCVMGFLDDNPTKQAQAIGRFRPLGGTVDLARVLQRHPVDLVIVTLPWRSRDRIVRLVGMCEAAGIRVRIVPDLFQMSLNRVDVDSLNGIPLIAVREPALHGWGVRVKRGLDIALSLTLLVLLAPLIAVIALAIRLNSPGPVFFLQQRVGRDGRLFTCFKFRSMVDGADGVRGDLMDRNEATGPIFKIKSDPRTTQVGRVIRRLSLDELPQLWNVLSGDMSLVGPRPPMPCEVENYAEWHRRRLDVAPGLTGLWQVSGRSDLTFDEMVMLDLFYAENWSLGLDLRILLRTVPSVLRGTGAY